MPADIPADLDLELEVALLEAEADLLEQLIAAGIMPPGARRAPTDHELRAGVRFAQLDRIVTEAAGLIARKAERVREHVLDGLAEQLAGILTETDPYAALEELDRLTNPATPDVLPGLTRAIEEATEEIRADLITTARRGAEEALEEARRQGIPDRLLPVDLDPVDERLESAAAAHAARVAKAPAERLLNVAAEAGGRAATLPGATGATVLEGALAGAEEASRAGTEDLAKQAANVTHGLGRTAAQQALPAPVEVYASELLDSRTCGPCATVDGRTYRDLTAALEDYPGAGGYIGCDGGARCRGTLVLVHGGEAPPTLDNPGQGPGSPGGPADRTPRGPSGVTRPDHIDADGNLIPTPPDKGTPPPSALSLDLDPVGRTIVPPTVEPPITTVAPAEVPRDPELAEYSDDELDALMADPSTPLERQLAAADEFDQRQAGNRERVYREEDLDPATLARYEAEREAWEAAGGDVIQAVATAGQAGGRRIDHVRAEWVEEVEAQQIAAEAATNGYLVRKDRAAEFRAKYGPASSGVLFEGPSRVAYYYASPELVDYWDTLPTGRPSFAEFALTRGITDRKTRDRARAAREAKDDARARADESAAGREKRARQRAEKARRRLPLTAGERLAQEQRRRDRIRAAERRADADRRRLEDPEEPDAATA